jgi:CheY-like chemotaxis protein
MTSRSNLPPQFKCAAIIDDIDEFQLLAQMMLQYLGVRQVACYESGVEALPELIEAPPDLLLLDVMMPDMDGLTLLGQLRQNPATARLPVILCTAAINQLIDHEEWLQRDACVQVLPKPFSIDDLGAALARLTTPEC